MLGPVVGSSRQNGKWKEIVSGLGRLIVYKNQAVLAHGLHSFRRL